MATLKDPLPRGESELGRNRSQKGDKSYYYAHNEGWQVPDHAIVRSGEGIITGGAPVPLGPDGKPLAGYSAPEKADGADDARDEVIAQLRARINDLESEMIQLRGSAKTLSQFSFSDEGAKCKVYLEVGAGVLEQREELPEGGQSFAEAAVSVAFTGKDVSVRVAIPAPKTGAIADRRAVTLVCEQDIVPEKCTYKVDRTKGRISLTLVKEDAEKKWKKGPTAQKST
eukprot:TRINITY_DN8645_c0_g1_i2.p1 TRINITY_DN8645_c0_g1~~TRINITY_DN8645_c0_g1_i2.p1  ORF type:complete len:265 (-),score=43.20 TRINITY_DN8645_c0_g1_i2:95-775(-)